MDKINSGDDRLSFIMAETYVTKIFLSFQLHITTQKYPHQVTDQACPWTHICICMKFRNPAGRDDGLLGCHGLQEGLRYSPTPKNGGLPVTRRATKAVGIRHHDLPVGAHQILVGRKVSPRPGWGIRQGDTLSPALFALLIVPFCQKPTQRILSVRPFLYADNTLVILYPNACRGNF